MKVSSLSPITNDDRSSSALRSKPDTASPTSHGVGLRPVSVEELARANPEAAAAAQQFEAVFMRQLLGSVDKMSSVGAASKTQGEVVGSMMKGVLAEQLSAAGGIGLAEVILRALTEGRHAPAVPHNSPTPGSPESAGAAAADEPSGEAS